MGYLDLILYSFIYYSAIMLYSTVLSCAILWVVSTSVKEYGTVCIITALTYIFYVFVERYCNLTLYLSLLIILQCLHVWDYKEISQMSRIAGLLLK